MTRLSDRIGPALGEASISQNRCHVQAGRNLGAL